MSSISRPAGVGPEHYIKEFIRFAHGGIYERRDRPDVGIATLHRDIDNLTGRENRFGTVCALDKATEPELKMFFLALDNIYRLAAETQGPRWTLSALMEQTGLVLPGSNKQIREVTDSFKIATKSLDNFLLYWLRHIINNDQSKMEAGFVVLEQDRFEEMLHKTHHLSQEFKDKITGWLLSAQSKLEADRLRILKMVNPVKDGSPEIDLAAA